MSFFVKYFYSLIITNVTIQIIYQIFILFIFCNKILFYLKIKVLIFNSTFLVSFLIRTFLFFIILLHFSFYLVCFFITIETAIPTTDIIIRLAYSIIFISPVSGTTGFVTSISNVFSKFPSI